MNQHLKWNFEEFQITFTYKKSKTQIWKYYLQELVLEPKKYDDNMVPKLHDDFKEEDAKKLWDHLLEVFVPESTRNENLAERQLILKCMILLY